MPDNTSRNLSLILLGSAMPGALGHGPVAAGGTAGFFSRIAKFVISLLHACACQSTEHLEGHLPCAPLCSVPSFAGRFGREAWRKTQRESLSPHCRGSAAAAGTALLRVPAGYGRGRLVPQPPAQRGAAASPARSLVFLFPLVLRQGFHT